MKTLTPQILIYDSILSFIQIIFIKVLNCKIISESKYDGYIWHSTEKQSQPKRQRKQKKSSPLIDSIPNDPEPDAGLDNETTFQRIIKASNAAYEDFDYESFDNSFDDSVCRDAIRQEML